MDKDKKPGEATIDDVLLEIKATNKHIDEKFVESKDYTDKSIDDVLQAINDSSNKMEKRFGELGSRVGGLESKVNSIESKMATKDDLKELEDRFTSKVDAFMGKTIKVKDDQSVMTGQIADVRDRIEILEKDVKQMKPVLGLS